MWNNINWLFDRLLWINYTTYFDTEKETESITKELNLKVL